MKCNVANVRIKILKYKKQSQFVKIKVTSHIMRYTVVTRCKIENMRKSWKS